MAAPSGPVAQILSALGEDLTVAGLLLEQLSFGVAVFDREGGLRLHNSALGQLLGTLPARVQDLTLGADGTSPVPQALSGGPITGEELDLRVGEATRRVRLSLIPATRGGSVIGGVLVLVDAAERPGAEASARE